MRVSKKHDSRRNEILNKAESLFQTIGFNKTTVSDILSEVNIAKGTFYYYFRSKEEVLDAIIERYMEIALERVQAVRELRDLTPTEKLLQIFMALRMGGPDNKVIEELHKPENALMHQKSFTQIILGMTPILAEVVEEGIAAGCFKTQYPVQTVQIILSAGLMLFDDGIFSFSEAEQYQIIQAIIYSLETLLGAEKNSFDFWLQAFMTRT